VEAAQSEWDSLTESNDPRHAIERYLAGSWLGRAQGSLPAAEECLEGARQQMVTSGYTLYAKGIKRLEKALRHPSEPADLRF